MIDKSAFGSGRAGTRRGTGETTFGWDSGPGLLAGLAAYAYFVGTATLVEHAEALAFRRLSVSQVGRKRCLPSVADADTEIENVVLTAPDVDHREFNERFRRELLALADNAAVYVSSNDRALLVSRLTNSGKRLGERSVDPSDPSQLAQTERLGELLDPGSDRLALIDVTAVNRIRNFHNFSLETPEFFDDLFLRLTGRALPQTLELYAVETVAGARYFVLTRGR